MTLVNPDSGRVHKHPAVGVAEVAAQLRALAGEFGLTPAPGRHLSHPCCGRVRYWAVQPPMVPMSRCTIATAAFIRLLAELRNVTL